MTIEKTNDNLALNEPIKIEEEEKEDDKENDEDQTIQV